MTILIISACFEWNKIIIVQCIKILARNIKWLRSNQVYMSFYFFPFVLHFSLSPFSSISHLFFFFSLILSPQLTSTKLNNVDQLDDGFLPFSSIFLLFFHTSFNPNKTDVDKEQHRRKKMLRFRALEPMTPKSTTVRWLVRSQRQHVSLSMRLRL